MLVKSQHSRVSAAVIPQATVVKTAVVEAPKAVQPVALKVASGVQVIPAEKCNVALKSGGAFAVLAEPVACNGVAIESVKINVSDKPCAAAAKSDFRTFSHSTVLNGKFGVYVENKPQARCFQVAEITGKYL
ncbi:hypothetical protein KKP04_00970 [Rhodomicrobium sp. Az07]|uniref:hypothetical protein n=1 Tax=Rhodomicrobium sp. Az07 TaxID=2839034 RepID=UPI001BE93243|nr:hypothetical protein [Rhodomicrobium sp. Az07]MBT3069441.1 hypothetical protein [Rhodomicrobium sp. Az07]